MYSITVLQQFGREPCGVSLLLFLWTKAELCKRLYWTKSPTKNLSHNSRKKILYSIYPIIQHSPRNISYLIVSIKRISFYLRLDSWQIHQPSQSTMVMKYKYKYYVGTMGVWQKNKFRTRAGYPIMILSE